DVQEVVEVVGDASGEAAEGLHALGLAQLALQLAGLRDVAQDGEMAAGKEVGGDGELDLPTGAVGPVQLQAGPRPLAVPHAVPDLREVEAAGRLVQAAAAQRVRCAPVQGAGGR